MRPTDPPMNLSRAGLDLARNLSVNVLRGLRDVVSHSVEQASDRRPTVAWLDQFIGEIEKAGRKTVEGLNAALDATTDALTKARQSVDMADETIRKALFENVAVSSIAGASFAGITISEIRPSFRRNGRDVGIDEALEGSTDKALLLCVPGLFCDEGMWSGLHSVFEKMGYHPLYVRFNPGAHISDNGQALLEMITEITTRTANKVNVVTYSQGGLILRSALYLMSDRSRMGRLLLISSPDGGSYIEKIGFWVNAAADAIPLFPARLFGQIGNERSDAMKDLSHGLIREEDWKNDPHPERYGRHYYFGELDGLDAYQAYGLITEDAKHPASVLGDGVVERPSLERLQSVYKAMPATETGRVHCFTGLSHYSIIGSEQIRALIERLFA
ncbi:MAG: alpha/beta hydrolase [Leptonema illini]|uniref:Alpha/beta hydrolase n=1 Tax=Leptonema illini TaxID=183 RepID=A0A833LZN0_9LEPT|nr:MAG: alpha/beta hydrolase [Leptonema illini]